jgi:FlaA1/EpsC-like NDP-sugar epimerase
LIVLSRWRFPLLLLLIDAVLVNLAYLLSLFYRFSYDIPKQYLQNYLDNIVFMFLIYAIIFISFGIYKSLWAFAGTDEFLIAIAGGITAGGLNAVVSSLMGNRLPISVLTLATVFSTMFVCAFRITFRIYRRILIMLGRTEDKQGTRVMVIGAGSAGALILKEMRLHKGINYKPVAIIDDNPFKQGTTISGVKVYGDRYKIKQIAKEKLVETIIIAIPTLGGDDKKEIIEICKSTGCKIKMVPGIYEIINDRYLLRNIRNVDVEDLLGRETVKLDMEGISDYLEDKVVLVTGGGGSIGSELCRQITKFKPRQLIILDIYENNAYDLQNELKFKYPILDLKVLIASVRDKKRLEGIFIIYRPEVVFHAAAHKHVPLMEDNPSEAIKNNVFGTLNLSECADKYGVKRFVMISTDKAVNPTNIMGASKRMCEMIVQAIDKVSQTEFVAVRFGNVLGSNGSVIPLFKKQIANGGPITLTHKEITRFFMTIPEASQLVLQAGAFAKGGEIFVLDMGKPVKIYDLACDLVRLSGMEPEKDIKIKVTGLRPGEKLYEELLMDEEGLDKTMHEKILVGSPTFSDMDVIRRSVNELMVVIENGSSEDLVRKIEEVVPTYKRVEYTQTTSQDTREVAASIDNVKRDRGGIVTSIS